ncbi:MULTISPECIES: dihydroorotate dehydrogenase-like protein [unclassified Synechocystis]|uniref:dihydroorotate dehydrogenase-like protein n=1 Tax=unclassified Synechocystis TaxID=2640012 RepID=UPI0004259DD6|nr:MULTISPECIES: dihydroorotate dehydrogenase-like protein [unclassified Synechocystis]AIE74227.1 Putative dihydropyrimidine dehydrogenase [NADP+], similar to dihydroorotate dehydrogenase [Synechocystis sp. PCC 6714]MCT0252855.1 dihydroorotate dehydrogenase-like protein [Synechocystis sp. CS-94]
MDLTTQYLGLNLKSPLVVGSCAPLTEDLDNLKKMEDSGAAAIVLHSFFEEQLRQERLEMHYYLTHGTNSFAEALTYFPEPQVFHVGSDEYLNHIRMAKESLNIPIIGSLNGSTLGGWLDYSQQIEQAGADAIELNIYYVPTDLDVPGAEVEKNYIDIVKTVKAEVNIPVSVKIAPFFSNMAYMAKKFADNGADGLVLFNRFYQPDFDLESLEVYPHILLSTPQSMRLPLHWLAILYGRVDCDLAATSGVLHTVDLVKVLMAGAKISQLVSALLRHGVGYLQTLQDSLSLWMEEHGYESVRQMQGSMSQLNCPDPTAFERVQYVKALQTYAPIWKALDPVEPVS